ncbi:MAG: hypothetical protein FWF19_06280 [Euryarchaeota archaeon]|nr:hypothetical protein [Euryarchaeota archaeon]
MTDSMRYADWFNKAESELESAEILMAHDGNHAVCYRVKAPLHENNMDSRMFN